MGPVPNVKIRIDLNRVQRTIGRIPERLHAEVVEASRETARFGRTAVQQTIASTNPQPVATGTYRNGWEVEDTPNGSTLLNRTKQGYFVEFGRRPGKMPPEAPIMQWLRVKGITSPDRSPRSLAWMIRRKIARKGTKGRYILQRTQPKMRAYFDHRLRERVKRARMPR